MPQPDGRAGSARACTLLLGGAPALAAVSAPVAAFAAAAGGPPAAWRLEPGLLVWALAAVAAYGALWAGLRPRPPRLRALSFGAGTAVAVLALSSPLDSMGETVLLTMHMLEHMALTLAAALLLVGGIPRSVLARVRALPVVGLAVDRLWGFAGMMLYNAVVLAWHVPALYEAALRSEHVHDLEHLCFLLSAMLFWGPVLLPLDRSAGRQGAAWRLAGVLITLGVNTALGSYLYFVQNVLYPTYGAAPRVWGLVDPLTDQSIAGGALWSMGDLAYIVAGLALVGRWLLRQRGPQDLSDGGLEGPGSAR